MLIPEKLNAIIRVLVVNLVEDKPNLTLSTLAKKAGITPAMAKRLVIRLEKSEYVTISRTIKVVNPTKLIQAWAYTYSIRELERSEFLAAERPQYIMLKISNIARRFELPYAFTLFSATEQISPYVAPSDTYLYVLKKDIKRWEVLFRSQNLLPTEKDGNVICLLVDEDYLEGVWTAREMKVVSLPQLYADLFSYGGRGEEAAEQIMEIMNRRLRNV